MHKLSFTRTKKKKKLLNPVGATRDGHEYHEIWAARKSLQLLLPNIDLAGIAMEGFHSIDREAVSQEAVEIADLTLYYGSDVSFAKSDRTVIVQFKYSISKASDELRVSEAKKTIEKFAAAFNDHIGAYGIEAVRGKLEFEYITNRPISEGLIQAIHAIAHNSLTAGDIKTQATQFKAATKLKGDRLSLFAQKLSFVGGGGNLQYNKQALSLQIVNWSTTNDALAKARLGQLKGLVREKAAAQEGQDNVIYQTDILHVLGVSDRDELLPAIDLPSVGKKVKRAQLNDARLTVPTLQTPLVVHAAGGIGKTVFMDSLASELEKDHEVVFFDCFGGGAYRSPEDGRHLPRNGLMQIANSLAFRGLCDPILPESSNNEALVRAFRQRLEQCVATIAAKAPSRQLVLFIDAIDNAQAHADENREHAFPTLLLDSLKQKPIESVKLVVSCRTERKPTQTRDCADLQLIPFGLLETTTYLKKRLPGISQAEIQIAQAKSQGNARVLEYLVKEGLASLRKLETANAVELDELIQNRIQSALVEARNRGYSEDRIDTFLAGIGALPPPIPLDEYAAAQGMPVSAIESFVADLSPLLERTSHGLMFRDEPTETFVIKRYSASNVLLRQVADNLNQRQDDSVYAARALPNLLRRLGDSDGLFKLALDERFPGAISSPVGKRNIRYARLKAACSYVASKRDLDRLVPLLVEVSTIAEVEERGGEYIVEHPDLVVIANDTDAIRRLFEIKANWQGSRHVRLTIAYSLLSDVNEAYRHARLANDWIDHFRRNRNKSDGHDEGPAQRDYAAIPFFLIAHGRPETAYDYLGQWHDWYAFEIVKEIFQLVACAEAQGMKLDSKINTFLRALEDKTHAGLFTGVLTFGSLSRPRIKKIISSLAKLRVSENKFREEFSGRQTGWTLQDGLRYASALALQMKLKHEAVAISELAPHKRPNSEVFTRQFSSIGTFSFLFHVALESIVNDVGLHEIDVLPQDILDRFPTLSRDTEGSEFKKSLKKLQHQYVEDEKSKVKDKDKNGRSEEYKNKEIESFIDYSLAPVLQIAKSFAKLLAAPTQSVDRRFLELLDTWEVTRQSSNIYSNRETSFQLNLLGMQMAVFAIWSRDALKESSLDAFVGKAAVFDMLSADMLIKVILITARRPLLHQWSGEKAVLARSMIQGESGVPEKGRLLAELSKAILPASTHEAVTYFRQGIEQMDAIGSGDYGYANELLNFASAMKGEELEEKDFHTLANISELNLWDEPGKFDWGSYGAGLAVTAGARGLAKISRLASRDQAALEYTLLPCLTGLVKNRKIPPTYALSLNYLAAPAELYVCNTEAFAKAINSVSGNQASILIGEAITQYKESSHGHLSASTAKTLRDICASACGDQYPIAAELTAISSYLEAVYKERNDLRNSHSWRNDSVPSGEIERPISLQVDKILSKIISVSEKNIEEVFSEYAALDNRWSAKEYLFPGLRSRVQYAAQPEYIGFVADSLVLTLSEKLDELTKCKDLWSSSSSAVADRIRATTSVLIKIHADELVDYGHINSLQLGEIKALTELTETEIAIELASVFSEPDCFVSGQIWLSLASHMCPSVSPGVGQEALTRLLRSDSAQLSSNARDGAWRPGLYPESNVDEIAACLLWFSLGSYNTADRWRAAHSIRSFAKFSCWNVLDALLVKIDDMGAGPFEAKEPKFFYLNARLWLLISLARLAKDFPSKIASYKDVLLKYAIFPEVPHALTRHFACEALLELVSRHALVLSSEESAALIEVNQSAFPIAERNNDRNDFYSNRASNYKESAHKFSFEYEFSKHQIDGLASTFGEHTWAVSNHMAKVAKGIDPEATGMYDLGGAESKRTRYGEEKFTQSYGEYLAWHSLFIVADSLLKNRPMHKSWSEDAQPWEDWFRSYTLTRKDGLWLSDGTGITPSNLIQNLLEEGNARKRNLALTGDKSKLINLVLDSDASSDEITIDGRWSSNDDVSASISSGLFKQSIVEKAIRRLLKEDPFQVWLPHYEEYRASRSKDIEGIPFVAIDQQYPALDEADPHGTRDAASLLYICEPFASKLGLVQSGHFGLEWSQANGDLAVRNEVWSARSDSSGELQSGHRLRITPSALRKLLIETQLELLVLIRLRLYERSVGQEKSKYFHTIGVLNIRAKDELEFDFHLGRVNHEHKSSW